MKSHFALALATALTLSVVTAAPAFPFEGCKKSSANNRYSATFVSYMESPAKNTSRFCMDLKVSAADACTPNNWRCCDTTINKIKLFPALNCRRSIAKVYIYANGANYTANGIIFEKHKGFDIVKVTPLAMMLNSTAQINNTRVCFDLRKPCWTLQQFSFYPNKLQYSLYDKKKNGYECCPTGGLILPTR